MNLLHFPATDTLTPKQVLQSAMRFADNDNLQDVLIVGYDGDGELLIRSSRMDRKDAVWLAEQLQLHALGCEGQAADMSFQCPCVAPIL